MAYNYNYIYFGIPVSIDSDAFEIRFPNKYPLYTTWGTRIGGSTATYDLNYTGGTASFVVYRLPYTTYQNYIDIDNINNAWCDSYNAGGGGSMSSYASLQYTQYKVWKYANAITAYSNTALANQIYTQGDSQYASIYIYLFNPNVIDSTYAKWKASSVSGYDREFKYHSTTSTNSTDSFNIGFTTSTMGTRIIKLCTSGLNNGLFNTKVVSSSGGSTLSLNGSNYKGYNLTDLTTSGTLSTSANGVDKVYVLHHINSTTQSLYGAVNGSCYSYNGSISEVVGRYYYSGGGTKDAWTNYYDIPKSNMAYYGFTGI